MKKNIFAFVLMFTIFMNSFTSVYAAATVDMLKDNVAEGMLTVVINDRNTKTKVMIEKGSEKYYYNLTESEESFPLQLGKGSYTVSVLENTSGNKYRVLKQESFTANIGDENAVYLNSAQPVKWNKDMEAIKIADSMESVEEIYEYIVNNIQYDYSKLNGISNDYVPNIDEILSAKKGICYDYAALLGAMLRSKGIPTKLVKGYKDDIKAYHAWNEVYLEDKWIVVDTTYDSWSKKSGQAYSMEKNEGLYNKQREF